MAQEQLFTNNATTTIPLALSSGATSFSVATGTGDLFPSITGAEFFIATIVNNTSSDPGYGQLEIVKVTGRIGDAWSVVRGQEGTAPTSFPANAVIELRPTAQAFDNLYDQVALKANINSPTFTGTPTAPTPANADNSTKIATTAWVTDNTPGRLLRTTVFIRIAGVQNVSVDGGAFTTTDASTFTSLPETSFIIAEGLGGGGGGGGSAATAAGQISGGQGGGAGSYGKGHYASGFSGGIAISVGNGSAGSSATASNGGTTTIGALMSVPGGSGGKGGAAVTAPAFGQSATPGSAAPTGANMIAVGGESPQSSILLNSLGGNSGRGGNSIYGSGGGSQSVTSNGLSGSGYGAGGGGSLTLASSIAQSGGNGTAGIVIIYEFA